jgi:dipeptidyl aminopeptidase/acylaminoacyl peptidase
MKLKLFLPVFFIINIFADPYPIDYWAVDPGMSNVNVSLNGKYISYEKKASKRSDVQLEILETDNLSSEPFIVTGDVMEIITSDWVSDDQLIIIFRQQVRDSIEGFNQGIYSYKAVKLDLDTKKFTELDKNRTVGSGKVFSTRVTNILPNDPNTILISYAEAQRGQTFRNASYYKYNLKTGKKRLVLKGNERYFNVEFDNNANPISSTGYDERSKEYIYYTREPGSSTWVEVYRQSIDDYEDFDIVSTYIDDNKSKVYVIANNGEDKTGLWLYDLKNKKYISKIYSDNLKDLNGPLYHYNQAKYPDEFIGVTTFKDRLKRIFLNSDLTLEVEALYYQLEQIIPNSHTLSIVSSDYDSETFVVKNTAPNDPGSYYLIHNNQITYLGNEKPFLKSEDLASLSYISYPSSDGQIIYAYVHTPKGNGPHPLVVMPHGGPFVEERILFDEWPQFFANNGYMVIQPQYRGSYGYGIDFHKKAFIDGGEGGKKMQDDLDYGAKYLIEKGQVDKDNVYMFGWSYGGYTSLIASMNKEKLYKCTVAGAAVADLVQQYNYYGSRLDGAQKVRQEAYSKDSINPIDHIDEIKVPLLIIHGDNDQRVPIKHAYKFVEELNKKNIEHEFIVLEGADHFLGTIGYTNMLNMWSSSLDFIKSCN